MQKIIQRVHSFFADKSFADERLHDLIIELRSRGIQFRVEQVLDDGKEYFVAESIAYPRGSIITSAETLEELPAMLKDATFTAFGVPSRYCHPDIIHIGTGTLSDAREQTEQVYVATT